MGVGELHLGLRGALGEGAVTDHCIHQGERGDHLLIQYGAILWRGEGGGRKREEREWMRCAPLISDLNRNPIGDVLGQKSGFISTTVIY